MFIRFVLSTRRRIVADGHIDRVVKEAVNIHRRPQKVIMLEKPGKNVASFIMEGCKGWIDGYKTGDDAPVPCE